MQTLHTCFLRCYTRGKRKVGGNKRARKQPGHDYDIDNIDGDDDDDSDDED